MKTSIFITTSVLLLWSCQKEIPLKDEEVEPHIVVNSIFGEDDTVWVHLSESRNVLYDSILPNITTANAKFLDADGGIIGNFVHDADGNYFCTPVNTTAGTSYGISVSYSDFDSVSASTQVPATIGLSDWDTSRTGQYLNFEISFSDPAAESNYYAVTVGKILMYVDEFGDTIPYTTYYSCTPSVIVQNGTDDGAGQKCDQEFYFSDETFNGLDYTFPVSIYDDEIYISYVIYLRSLSEEYYKYRISYSKYMNVAFDPFAQPVQVFSNIDNGFGIFGGFSEVRDTIFN